MATTVRQHAEVLGGLRLFRAVPSQYIGDFLKRCPLEEYGTGEVLFRQGDEADRAMLVVSGRLVSAVGEGMNSRTVGEVLAGEVVGETALFVDGGRRSATVTATEPTRCLLITQELLRSSPDSPAVVAVERHLLGSMARRIRSTNLNIQKIWKDDGWQPEVQRGAASGAEAPPLTIRQRLRKLFGGK